jgi:Ca-activated chloride channel family protein
MATCILTPQASDDGLCEILSPGTGGNPLRGEAPKLHAEAPLVDTRARVVVLFSDGEDSEGHALEEAAIARSYGIELFVVAVGTKSGELIPTLDDEGQVSGWLKDESGAFVTSKLQSESLRQLSTVAEGSYYSLGEGSWRGEALIESLQELKRGDLDTRVVRSRRHIFERFLFPAFLLLMIEACLPQRKRGVGLPRPEGGREQE